jgi:hypothetical protein
VRLLCRGTRAGGCDPDCLAERFSVLADEKPPAWMGNWWVPGIVMLAQCRFATSRVCSDCSCQVLNQSACVYRQSVQAAYTND